MICSWEKVESVQLEYKYSVRECLTYCQIQIMERHDAKTHVDETIEYIQMNYTEEINEINHENYIQRRVHNLQIIPDNKTHISFIISSVFVNFEDNGYT